MAEGIRKLHSVGCAGRAGGRCGCRAGYEAFVYSTRDQTKVRKTLPTLAAARAWRVDALAGLRLGTVRAPRPVTVLEAGEQLLSGMRSGVVRTRSGDVYKPSAIRSYEAALRLHVLPELGGMRLADVQRRDVQRLADDLLAAGRDPSTIRNALMPLRVIYRRALQDGDVVLNPSTNLRLAASRGRRERIASPEQAAALIAVLPPPDRAVWALALYAGLRRGELMALKWDDVDLAAGVIRVERSWDAKSRLMVEPKSRAGRRRVPIAAVLRDVLAEHKMVAEGDLVVGGTEAGLRSTARASSVALGPSGGGRIWSRSVSTKPVTPSRA
ncbi:MAG: site-specific integrase [Gaiellaceae bacterium MAG52_C11]|nr:site-specific integrase [Candidatus Gaiellasilicea maunaloa]